MWEVMVGQDDADDHGHGAGGVGRADHAAVRDAIDRGERSGLAGPYGERAA